MDDVRFCFCLAPELLQLSDLYFEMASEQLCCMIQNLHLNSDHSIGASVEEKDDASRDGSKAYGDSFKEPAMTAEDSDSRLLDKSVATGASVVEKGEAEEDNYDTSDEDSDSYSHLFDIPIVATEENTSQDSDSDSSHHFRGPYRCAGCTDPDSIWPRPVQLSPFFDYPSDEERIPFTMEDIDAIFASGDLTIEYLNELQRDCFPDQHCDEL